MDMHIKGSVDLMITFPEPVVPRPDVHPPHGPEDPPDELTPCGACQFNLESMQLEGVNNPAFASYPVAFTRFEILDENKDRIGEAVENLAFVDRETGLLRKSGRAGDIMTQRIQLELPEPLASTPTYFQLTWTIEASAAEVVHTEEI